MMEDQDKSGAAPRRSPASQRVRLIFVIVALLLPTLSLVPLGGWFLWTKGWLLWWAAGAASTVGLLYFFQRRLLGHPLPSPAEEDAVLPGDVIWSPAEEKAWRDVKEIANRIDIDAINTSQDLTDLAHRAVNAVARRLHPAKSDALWQFTVPEALMITETVSNRLRSYIINSVPFGDRLTVSQFLTIYRWRHMIDVAERAYDVWRVIRLVNPATAATHEARERLSRAMFQWGRAHILRGLAVTLVEETGRAAIDLYGGRLKLKPVTSKQQPTILAGADPVQVLITGGSAVERAEVYAIAASAQFSTPSKFALRISDVDLHRQNPADGMLAEIKEADLVLLIVPSSSDDSDIVGAALSMSGDFFRAEAALSAPPLIGVFFARPSPSDRVLASRLAEALNRYSAPMLDRIEIAMPPAEDDYGANSALAKAILRAEPHARKVHILRDLNMRKKASDWASAGRQAVSAAGSLAGSVLSRLPLGRWK